MPLEIPYEISKAHHLCGKTYLVKFPFTYTIAWKYSLLTEVI